MENERKRLRFEILLERFFTNFHRLVLTNLLFAVPSAIIFIAFYYLNIAIFKGEVMIPVMLIGIIPLFPFYAGVVAVCRNIARGDAKVPVFRTFIDAVRMNFLHFLLHGVLIYLATAMSVAAISLYSSMLDKGWFIYGLLFVSILIALFLLYTAFYIPLMNITYDLPLRYVYKNSFLMSFGEFKNNFFATLALAVLLGICFTMTVFCRTELVLILILSAIWCLLLPAAFTFIYIFFIYDGMTAIIRDKEELSRELTGKIDKSLEERKKQQEKETEDDFSDIDVASLKDTDDYIFHNGKMVKQSTILRILREREQQEDKQ